MKKISLTKGKFAIVDDADFEVLNKWKWCVLSSGYAFRMATGNKSVLMHRFIMNTPKGMDTDHINKDRLDNRRENLRVASRSNNNANSLRHKNNTSGYKGVTKVRKETNPRNRWLAQIVKDGKYHYLGYHPTAEGAAIAYNSKAMELYGNFVELNLVNK